MLNLTKNIFPSFDNNNRRYRNRKGQMSESELMTIMISYHFCTYRTFKDYYIQYASSG